MLNFSVEQITQFKRWKEDFHNEINRLKKVEEDDAYYKTLCPFYKWLSQIEKFVDAVEIDMKVATVGLPIQHLQATIKTEITFGGLMERYSEQLLHILYYSQLDSSCETKSDQFRKFSISKIIELREIFNLFD